MMTRHASPHDAETRPVLHQCLAYLSAKALGIFPMVVAVAPKMSGTFDSNRCIECKLARKHCIPNLTSHAAESMQIVYLDICSRLETPI